MAALDLKLTKAEADAMQRDWPRGVAKSKARLSGERKLQAAIWSAFPELEMVAVRRAHADAVNDERFRNRWPQASGLR